MKILNRAGSGVASTASMAALLVSSLAFACQQPAAEAVDGTNNRPTLLPSGDRGGQGLDIVIENGRVVDGTGAAWFFGDVGVRDGRIVQVTPSGGLADTEARHRIDARRKVVAPGFIDIQSHSRGSFLNGDGRVLGKITQGITTEIMGEGWTNAPQNPLTQAGAGAVDPDPDGGAHDFSGPHGFNRWLEAMVANGVSPNVGSFLGATSVRAYAKGEEAGPATEAELDSMRKVTRWAMEDGAFGVASALIYPPGNFASTDELSEVMAAAAPYGGVYITHMRSEADRFLEAIDEAIEIGNRAGAPVEIYHLKAAGQRNYHKATAAIAKIDSARAVGLDVQANMYPYTAGGTGLPALLPPWASDGGLLLENLRDPEIRRRIHDEVMSDDVGWENLGALSTPEGVLVTQLASRTPDGEPNDAAQYVGKRLSEVAEDMGVDWVDAAIELTLMTGGSAGMVVFMMSEENVALQLQQPWMKFGTDAGGLDPATASGMAHPRSYGTYPRILGKYVREEGVLRLEDAIRKMSSAVATRLSIQDRGVLKPGMMADIVVFDPNTVSDRATFEEPHQLSVGIEHVLVNGVQVVQDGAHTGAKPGVVVRGPGYREASGS
ncbi:MAG: N-acyl-D-amino-acid deacylase family protein [Longimicrobiales bacterium]